MNTSYKIMGIIVLLSFVCPIIIFDGSIDDFAPKHMVSISETAQKGHLQGSPQTPGFYAFGSVIQNITGLSSNYLLYLPIQLTAYALIYLILIYKLTSSYPFASIVTFIELISGSTGTPKIFFWAHGLGYILFYLVIFSLINRIENNNSRKSEYSFLILIAGSSLAFISYNLYAMLIIFLLSILSLFKYSSFLGVNIDFIDRGSDKCFVLRNSIFSICATLIVVQLGLSNFVYNSFIPTLSDVAYLDLSGLDKFLMTYFSTKNTQAPIAEMLLEYPFSITLISTVKYTLLFLSILTFLLFITKKIFKHDILTGIDTITISLVIMSVLYVLLRYYIGGIGITLFYFPGIVCTCWLLRSSGIYKKWAIFVILSMLVLVPTYSYILFTNDFTNKDTSKFNYVEIPVNWHLNHKGDYLTVSDELTNNFYMLYSYDQLSKNNSNVSYQDISRQIKVMSENDTTTLAKITNDNIPCKYLMLNYKVNVIGLQNWIVIKPWNHFKNKIDNNPKINKIYDFKHISIYLS